MIWAIIIYLILLAALVLFYILYIDVFALVMLLCVLIIPFILGIILIWMKCTSAAALTCDADTFTAGESVPFTLTIRNQSPFAFPQTHAVIEVRHSFGRGTEKLRLRFPLQAKNITRMTFYVHAELCGSVDVTLKRLFVLDYLYLFRTGISKRQKNANVLILPKKLPIPAVNTSVPVLDPDSDVFGDRPGDDPSEIFGFHEYTAGDPISRIHWKLSSKSDKFLMKEFSTPIQKSILILLDYAGTGLSVTDKMKEAETMLTIFYSVVCCALEMHIHPTVCWYHAGMRRMEQYGIETPAQLKEVFRNLYSAITCMELDMQPLMDLAGEMTFSSITCITNRLPVQLIRTVDKRMTANQKTILSISGIRQEIPCPSDDTMILHVRPDAVQDDLTQLAL